MDSDGSLVIVRNDGKLYFHCAKEGHNWMHLNACSKAPIVFMIGDIAKKVSGRLNIRSVVILDRSALWKMQRRQNISCTNLCENLRTMRTYLEH